MVIALVISTTSTLSIEPSLMSAVANDEAVTYNNVPFTMAFQEDKQELSMGIDQMVGFSIKLVEVI